MRRLVVAASVLAAVVVPTDGQAAAGPRWGDCPEDVVGRCLRVRVPVDHARPGGASIDLAVSRIAAADPARRVGVLVLAPGGPGGAGLGLPGQLAPLLPRSVRDRYDLVGFDPRFTGRSAPVGCGLTEARLPDLTPWPRPGGTHAVAVDLARRCDRHAGAALPHMGTGDTARDLDLVRRALGERRISYLGYSYATHLGAVYQSLFPARVDRMVLDSAVDPARVWRGALRGWGEGTEVRFPDFAAWAAARDGELGLGATPAAVRAAYLDAAADLDRAPRTLLDGNPLTGNLLREGMREALYADAGFPAFGAVLADLRRGVTPALTQGQVVPILAGRAARASRGWPAVPVDNFAAGFLGVVCRDGAWPRDPAVYARTARREAARHPLAGAMAAGEFACAAWPTGPAPQRVRPAAAPTLVLGSTRDPAGPLTGTLAMRAALGERAASVTARQGGHGVYLLSGNACADALVSAFLDGGALPGDTSC
ncbi:putative hydrolase [Actinokineospora spheciospongiae]|uniref:Putative hydrolase n=1 Tax=Actinokineospora spheciospongiae TaxID=909613 RepID=W7IXG5_9PSEU|nr:alpha/beta hydrolase [Actinokineospora spheciospongiae]EWC61131.1 putative hydrolase [Actinokineospora spheciospongiae]